MVLCVYLTLSCYDISRAQVWSDGVFSYIQLHSIFLFTVHSAMYHPGEDMDHVVESMPLGKLN